MPAGEGEGTVQARGGSASNAAQGRAPFVAATVVRAQSPTSVRAGDSAIVRPDGGIEGFVGGTCAEASVRLYSLRAMESGEPLLLRILPGAAEGEPEAEEGSVTVKNPCLSGGALEVFLEPHLPAPTMRVVGSAPIAIALADLAGRVGYAVESGPAELAQPSADDAAVIVASHGHDEERVLTEALRSEVPYVALVASEVRGLAVRESLDLPEQERARLHTPAGLEIGAETPEEIALAILAEIVARRPKGEAGRAPRPRATGIEAVPAESPVPVPAEPAPVALSTETAIDPVCGMEVAVSEASIQLERDGDLYYFCSEGCRDTFSAQGVPDGAAH
ncbi:MAG TPA: XdhC family protein [Solirubrobacterales bacterium]|nr:XdhC family protein [Solirubrobacterales bacterium]